MSIDEVLEQIKRLTETKPAGWCERVIDLYSQATKDYQGKIAEADYANLLYDFAAFLQNNGLYHLIDDLYDRAMTIYRKLARREPHVFKYSIACVLVNLANMHNDQGYLDAAETEYVKALRIFKELAEIQPQYLSDVATALHNLATVYMEEYKDKKAENALKRALEIRRELAKENPSVYLNLVATTLDVLGNLYDRSKKYKAAEKAYLEALQIRRDLQEKDPLGMRADMASILHNLGAYYYGQGQYSTAEKYYSEVLEIDRALAAENPGAFNRHVAEVLYNLALVYSDRGNFNQAIEKLDEALSICTYLMDDDQEVHRQLQANILSQLASVYTDLKQFDQAKAKYDKVLEIRQALANINFEAYGVDLADSLVNLATLYSDLGEFHEAENSIKKAIELYVRLRDDHEIPCLEEYATALNNLGCICLDCRKFSEALERLNDALIIREDLASTNPSLESDVAMTLINLADVYAETGREDLAEDNYKRAKEILEKLARREPRIYRYHLAQTLSNLASIQSPSHSIEDAEREFKLALKIYRAMDKDGSSVSTINNVAGTLCSFAKLLLDYGDYSSAIKEYRKALRLYKELAIDNPASFAMDVSSVHFALSDVYEKSGDKKKSGEHYNEGSSIRRMLSEANPGSISDDDFKLVDRNGEKRYFFIGGSSRDKLIYKYFNVEAALYCLQGNSLRFQQPINWTDQYEGLYYKSDYHRVENGSQVRKDLYACCMAQSKSSEPAWKMYTYGGKGLKGGCVEFVFDLQKLRDELSNYAAANDMTVYEGKVKYSQSDYTIQTIGDKLNPLYKTFFHNFDLSKYLNLLLLKRQAFSHESEVRFFLIPNQNVEMKGYVSVNIQWDNIVKSILIDKSLGEWEKKFFKDYVKELLPNIEVEEYDIHEAPSKFRYMIE